MPRPKKVKEEEVELPAPEATPVVEGFDPSLPENKQRHLR